MTQEIKHETVKWKTFDGGRTYEPVCRCGYHSAHDLNFENHCLQRAITQAHGIPREFLGKERSEP